MLVHDSDYKPNTTILNQANFMNDFKCCKIAKNRHCEEMRSIDVAIQ